MKKLCTILLSCMAIGASAQQSWYVAPNGDNTNAGTINAPFATIQQAVDTMSAGDSCFIRKGTYHEKITLQNSQNLYFGAYQNEYVVIDGTIPVTTTWTSHGNNIYKTTISENIWQLFIDDKEQVMARWPNGQFDNNSVYDQSKSWALGDHNNGSKEHYTVANNKLANSNLDLNGAMAVVNIGSFKTFARKITQHTVGQDTFRFTPIPNNAYRNKKHYAFVECKLNLLDTLNEWYLDTLSKTLYTYGNPSGKNIKGKNQSYAFDISNSQDITLFDLNFFATTFRLNSSQNCVIDSCKLAFPNCSKRMLLSEGTPNVTRIQSNNSQGNSIRNCLFEYTDGEALRIQGDSNTIEQCYFHHIDWSCANISGVGASIDANSARNTSYINNTVKFTGASEMLIPGVTPKVAYNDFSNTGKVQSDGAIIQCTRTNVQDAQLHHNWLHDSEKYGLRFDAPISDPTLAGKKGKVHHNVVWNTGGMMIKGDEHIVAHNTCFGNSKNGIILLPDGGSNSLTITRNNAAQRFGGHRTAGPSSNNPIPGTHDHNWNGYLSSKKLDTLLTDTSGNNFIPKLSSIELIDSGVVITGITHPTLGNAPDLGAYEQGGALWKPGITWAPDFFPWDSTVLIISGNPTTSKSIDVTVYPNPAEHTLFVNCKNLKNTAGTLRLINSMGQVILEEQLSQHIYQIPVAKFNKGMYFLQLKTSEIQQTTPVIIH